MSINHMQINPAKVCVLGAFFLYADDAFGFVIAFPDGYQHPRELSSLAAAQKANKGR